MKKIIIAAISVLLLAGCGVGSYSVTSGKPDEAAISFTTATRKPTPITVTVDDTTYEIFSATTVKWKTRRNIKETAQNTITLTPGTHNVTVTMGGNRVYSQKLFLSAQDHKIIAL